MIITQIGIEFQIIMIFQVFKKPIRDQEDTQGQELIGINKEDREEKGL